MSGRGAIRAGIGGWTFEPWRGVFYPEKLPHAKGATLRQPRAGHHRDQRHLLPLLQTPATYAKWAKDVPDGFIFSLKGPRFATNRRVLAEAGDPDQALPRSWADHARRCARPDALAIRPDQEIRRRRFRRSSSSCCPSASTAASCATRWKSATPRFKPPTSSR